jgi:ABC-type uncharacterized transport system permease subunit
LGSSRLIVTESESRSAVVEEGLEVSKMRMRAVKICCAVGLGGAVQGPALKPRVEVRGGMA